MVARLRTNARRLRFSLLFPPAPPQPLLTRAPECVIIVPVSAVQLARTSRMDRALPRSPASWPAFLWSAALFTGPSSASADVPRFASLLGLIVLPAVLLYPCLGFRLFEPDESRYAQ